MELLAPRGTNDILPGTVHAWHHVEAIVRDTFTKHGYEEMRLPIFEYTDLFARGVGDTTDIVMKEMYTFEDRGGRSLTLRPEGTAQIVRAYVQHNMSGLAQPIKAYYMGPMFRYERPQKGRYRQFYQFGAEALGSPSPLLDVEMIGIPVMLYRALGLQSFHVRLNSIGCSQCRPAYREKLKQYLLQGVDKLCGTCQDRLERNPLRVLDCKNESCQAVAQGAPRSDEHLCSACQEHFTAVKAGLDALDLQYIVDPELVRGLDYYTRTVFELIGDDLGAQDALGGGGRYDGLVEEVGGPSTPGVGFAAGMERVLLSLEARGLLPQVGAAADIYVAAADEAAQVRALQLGFQLRHAGWLTELDYLQRSLRAQLRSAQRAGARWVVILGERELAANSAVVRQMDTGTQQDVPLDELVGWLEGKKHERIVAD